MIKILATVCKTKNKRIEMEIKILLIYERRIFSKVKLIYAF